MAAKRRSNASRRGRQSAAASRRTQMKSLQQRLLVSIILAAAVVVLLTWAAGDNGQAARWFEDLRSVPQDVAATEGRRVGIIAGHRNSDSGAVCPDGLTEAEVVEAIAQRVAQRLERLGAEVDLLAEYDPRLNGYVADAVVSIHADACIDRSGFKAARSEESLIPAQEDALVTCLNQHYGAGTGLRFDDYTVTQDMIGYHAFKRVAPQTAAAIIETGFLGGDRTLLTRRRNLVAQAITDGILCFLAQTP